MDVYGAVAFGCPAMGAEVLQEGEFQPIFDSVEGKPGGKKSGCLAPVDETPDEDVLDECRAPKKAPI